MLRIAYVEDEEIHKLCFDYHFPNLKYDYYEDPYSLLKAIKNGVEYDLIITDKKLGNYDSVENHLVNTLRQAGYAGIIYLLSSLHGIEDTSFDKIFYKGELEKLKYEID